MIYILPGMGASSKMYTSYKAWNTLTDASFIDWPPWSGERTLSEIASRLIEQYKIERDSSIIGSSLGGMIALEIAQLTKASKVILLGSAANPKEINSFLISLAPLAKITPIKFIQTLTGKYDNNFIDMFRSTDPEFIRHMCLAIKEWQGIKNSDFEIIRIHGEKDLVIKCPKNALKINNAGHLIAMTHVEDCVDLVRASMNL